MIEADDADEMQHGQGCECGCGHSVLNHTGGGCQNCDCGGYDG